MLRQLLAAWRGRNTLAMMVDQFDQMLAHDQWMFEQATATYWRESPWPEVQEPLYARDRQVNDIERSIRREVVRHMTIHPGEDVVACLVLMSVVKDAERIGDYCKNIFEVGKIFRDAYTSEQYVAPLRELHQGVLALFGTTRHAFRKSDSEAARSVLEMFGGLGKRCDRMVEELLRRKDDMSTDEAVSYGLLCRHMKRIGAHLSNIAGSVVTPVENLDFVERPPAPPGNAS